MSNFESSGKNVEIEVGLRSGDRGRLISFGIDYLDDALLGIRPDDLILLGAPSGVGKTQFCTNIAMSALEQGKRVHYFALEADTYEIERRIKFSLLTGMHYGNPNRVQLGRPLLYDEWECGMFEEQLAELEGEVTKYTQTALKDLYTYYKESSFDVKDLTAEVCSLVGQTDLIIIDHVHYFDWSGNDNDAMKEIAKTARDLVNQYKIPMILVAHLRKRDKNSTEAVAGLDEFHGSSDLAKIATKAITIASGGLAPDGRGFCTYMRTPKNRKGGGATRFIARLIFNDRTGTYDAGYMLGPVHSNSKTFESLSPASMPNWAGRSKRRSLGGGYHGV